MTTYILRPNVYTIIYWLVWRVNKKRWKKQKMC